MAVRTKQPGSGPGPVLAVLLTGQAMATMDGSIVAVAVRSIRDGLHASGAALQMIASGYVMAFAVLVVTGARLGDLWGSRRVFLLGTGCFTVTSAACGLAPTAGALVAARIAQGAAAALMVPQVLSLIQRHFDGERRSRAIGSYSLVLALGVAGGQIAGGLIVTANLFGAAWRPALLLNVPVGVVLIVVAARVLPPDIPTGDGRPVTLDVAGALLLAGAMAAVVVPVELGRTQGWPVWTWAVLTAGAAGLWVFWCYERRLATQNRQPLADPAMLRSPGVRPALTACCLVMGCYSAFLFTVTLHLQSGLGYTPLRAGLAFVPYTCGFAVTGIGYRRLSARLRAALPVLGPLCFAASISGMITLVVAHGGRPDAWCAPLLVVAGAGHAAGFSPLLARLAAAVAPRHASALSGLSSTGTLLASALGVVGIGSLYLAATENRPLRSPAGLEHVATATVVLLLASAAFALLAVRRLPDPSVGSPGRVVEASRDAGSVGPAPGQPSGSAGETDDRATTTASSPP